MVLWIVLSIVVVMAIVGIVFVNQPSFGRIPRGERLARIERSPNYRDGAFRNIHETPLMTSDKGRLQGLLDFVFKDKTGLQPDSALTVVKTDLRQINPEEDVLVWFGHSSYLVQVDGKRVLVDPVFCMASPVSFINKPFKGTDVYHPEDMPDIDYLVISHDHWDHLDYHTVRALKDRIGKVTVKVRICTGQVLEITVRDYGRGIPDVEKARQPMFTTGGEERSGMGFTIMESFMDSLKVRSVAGRGTTVVMKKKIAPRIKR